MNNNEYNKNLLSNNDYTAHFFYKASNPLDQFEIRNLLSVEAPILHISLTNIGLYLTIGALIVLVLSLIADNYKKVVSNN
jgi:F-type H+-transporting ATPase subunit a